MENRDREREERGGGGGIERTGEGHRERTNRPSLFVLFLVSCFLFSFCFYSREDEEERDESAGIRNVTSLHTEGTMRSRRG